MLIIAIIMIMIIIVILIVMIIIMIIIMMMTMIIIMIMIIMVIMIMLHGQPQQGCIWGRCARQKEARAVRLAPCLPAETIPTY